MSGRTIYVRLDNDNNSTAGAGALADGQAAPKKPAGAGMGAGGMYGGSMGMQGNDGSNYGALNGRPRVGSGWQLCALHLGLAGPVEGPGGTLAVAISDAMLASTSAHFGAPRPHRMRACFMHALQKAGIACGRYMHARIPQKQCTERSAAVSHTACKAQGGLVMMRWLCTLGGSRGKQAGCWQSIAGRAMQNRVAQCLSRG